LGWGYEKVGSCNGGWEEEETALNWLSEVVEFPYPPLGVLVTLAVEVMLLLILMLENDIGDAVRQLAG
jgi:hypothetical protein